MYNALVAAVALINPCAIECVGGLRKLFAYTRI